MSVFTKLRPIPSDLTTHTPLTPPRYLRLRREAIGMTRHDLAARLAELLIRNADAAKVRRLVQDRPAALDLVVQLETEGVTARHRETIEAIGAITGVDADVYHALATQPPERHPQICRGCACSDGAPCVEGGVCTWAAPNLCTGCIERGLRNAEAA